MSVRSEEEFHTPHPRTQLIDGLDSALVGLLASHSSLALAVTDADGIITLGTPALKRIVGCSVEGLTDKEIGATLPVYDFAGRRRLDPDELCLVRARRGEVVLDQMLTLKRPGGKLIYLRCNAAPLREPSGRICGAINLVQDMTAEWSAMLTQAKLRDRLITTVNHELRTPMTIIMGHAEILMDALDEGALEPFRQSVTAIARAGDQLADLAGTITSLVDLKAVSCLERVPVDLVRLVREVGQSHQAAASATGVALRIDLDAPLEGEFDVKLVRRAVGELLENAIALAPPRSEITLQASASAWDGVVEVRVADHGPGICPYDRERLVQPFERGANADPLESSQGLGLALAKAVAAGHGGSLILEENKPSGLVVRLLLGRH